LKENNQASAKVKEVKLKTLRRDFENIKQKENECVSDYCVRFEAILNKMDTLGEDLEKANMIKKLLSTLIEKANMIN